MKKTPNRMKSIPDTMPPYIIDILFIVGIISALAFRIIIVFQHIEPKFVRPIWYIGIIGYLVFFLYRYLITQKRRRYIEEHDLLHKLRTRKCLREEREVVIYLINSITRSRENLNYLFIFVFSIIAIIADLILSSIK